MNSRTQLRLRQSAAAVAVVVLHAVFVGALFGVRTLHEFRPEPRDTVTWIIVAPIPASAASSPPTTIQQLNVFGSVLPPLSAPVITLPTLPNPKSLSLPSGNAITLPNFTPNLSLQLFDLDLRCVLDKYDDLPREEKTHCTDVFTGLNSPGQYELTMDEEDLQARWEREYARKQAPLLVPCVSPRGLGDFITTAKCLADIAANGFDPDRLPTYASYPEASGNR